jgi:hypothetical protein
MALKSSVSFDGALVFLLVAGSAACAGNGASVLGTSSDSTGVTFDFLDFLTGTGSGISSDEEEVSFSTTSLLFRVFLVGTSLSLSLDEETASHQHLNSCVSTTFLPSVRDFFFLPFRLFAIAFCDLCAAIFVRSLHSQKKFEILVHVNYSLSYRHVLARNVGV